MPFVGPPHDAFFDVRDDEDQFDATWVESVLSGIPWGKGHGHAAGGMWQGRMNIGVSGR